MHVAEAGIVLRKLKPHVCAPRLDFLAPMEAGAWRNQIVVKEIPCAPEGLVPPALDKVCKEINRKNRGQYENTADRETFEPADDGAGVCVEVVVVSSAVIDPEIERAPHLQGPVALSKRAVCVGRMMDDAVGNDRIERFICERQRQRGAENA